jgi:hypothetical protein
MFEQFAQFKGAAAEFSNLADQHFDSIEASLGPALDQKTHKARAAADNGKHPHWKFEGFSRDTSIPFQAHLTIGYSFVCAFATYYDLTVDGVRLLDRDHSPPIRELRFADCEDVQTAITRFMGEWFQVDVRLLTHPLARPVTEAEVRTFFKAIRERYEERFRQRCLEEYKDFSDEVANGIPETSLQPPTLFLGAEEHYGEDVCGIVFGFCHLYNYYKGFEVHLDTGHVEFWVEESGVKCEAWFGEPGFPECFFERFDEYLGGGSRRKKRHQAYLEKKGDQLPSQSQE